MHNAPCNTGFSILTKLVHFHSTGAVLSETSSLLSFSFVSVDSLCLCFCFVCLLLINSYH